MHNTAYFHGSQYKPKIACVECIAIGEEYKYMIDEGNNYSAAGYAMLGL